MGTVYKMNPQRKAKRKTKRISVAPTWNLCICHVMLSRQGYKWINGLSVGVTEMQNEVLNEHVMDTTSKGRWSALSDSVFVFLLFLINCAFVFVFAFLWSGTRDYYFGVNEYLKNCKVILAVSLVLRMFREKSHHLKRCHIWTLS